MLLLLALFFLLLFVGLLNRQDRPIRRVEGNRDERGQFSDIRTPQAIPDHGHNPKRPAACSTVEQQTPKLLSMIEAIHRINLTLERIEKSMNLIREKLQRDREITEAAGSAPNIGVPTDR